MNIRAERHDRQFLVPLHLQPARRGHHDDRCRRQHDLLWIRCRRRVDADDAPGSSTITYAYNAAGDQTEEIDGGTTSSYTGDVDNEVTQAGSTTYTYDANGDLASVTDSSGTTTYAYNDLNQLVSITAPDGTVTTFQYSPLGFLVGENVGGTQTNYLVDPTGGSTVVASITAAAP